MIRRLPALWLAVLVTLICSGSTLAQAPVGGTDSELKGEIAALSAFHEVIYPLWHEAWPKRDVAMMKELLPQVRERVAAIEKAELPGILRDKQEQWAKGVERLTAALRSYEDAATGKEEQALLDAVEELHARFEALAHIVRPKMKELEAYHVVLYRVYHKLLPAKEITEIRTASDELVEACQTLAAAPIPRRFAAREELLGERLADLCKASAELRTAAQGGELNTIENAILDVHTRYQLVEQVFDQAPSPPR